MEPSPPVGQKDCTSNGSWWEMELGLLLPRLGAPGAAVQTLGALDPCDERDTTGAALQKPMFSIRGRSGIKNKSQPGEGISGLAFARHRASLNPRQRDSY